jgi:Iap family predicted aminopeptidase
MPVYPDTRALPEIKQALITAINKNLLFLIFTSLDDKVIIIKDECFQFVAV